MSGLDDVEQNVYKTMWLVACGQRLCRLAGGGLRAV